jgi:homoserine dehydrogenase
MKIPVIVVGFGNVGRALVLELVEGAHSGFFSLVGVVSSRGAVIICDEDGLQEVVELARRGEKLEKHRGFSDGVGAVEAASEAGAELAFIAIPPSYRTGEPNRSIYYGLAGKGVSIVTADKTVLAWEYEEFKRFMAEKGLFLGYRATVAAGTPVLDVARGLRGRRVERVRAVLNATTNYILTLVEKGMSYSEAVEEAIREQLAEPDPTIDTHGYDPAAKIAITVSELGYTASIRDVERVPLDTVDEEDVRRAIGEGYRYKYVAEADLKEKKLIVHPVKLREADRLALASGITNIVEFVVEDVPVIVEGPAGPAWRTAKVMVTDALEYIESRRGLNKE